MIQALIFDFGRVISAQKPASLFRSYEKELGLKAGTINTIMFESSHWQRALIGELDWTGYWQAIGPELYLSTKSEIQAFAKRYYLDERLNKSVAELLHSCSGQYRLAILSNHPPGLSAWLAEWGIDQLFEVVFCSGDEGAVKPDREVYLKTLDRLGVSPDKAVFVDDTPTHVRAATALGMHGIVFTTAADLNRQISRLPAVHAA